MTRTVAVVPHTHWDREWYLPFERFRLRLVELLDDLLPRLDADPSYAHFLLDGQMAVVDDHVSLRPHHADVIRRLVASGRLSVGPWYTLPDEFLVSGETLIRNLQLGLARAAGYGGAMEIGYLPDMFGHAAQMPQILRLFGFEHAVVWRGVPSAIDATAFWWEAPDGSRVRAEYLPTGYGNGADVPDDAKALVARVRHWEADQAALLGVEAPILWMNGSDHETPQAWLGRVVAEANDVADGEYRFAITSLATYLAGAPTRDLPAWRGELRSGARANVLMGVASNRVDVRVAVARAERALEQYAEPLCALFLRRDRWPEPELDQAWLEMVRNAAHDSVCACSVDTVCDAVLHRYAEATDIAQGLVDRVRRAVGASVGHAGPIVINPSARTRSGVVAITLQQQDAPAGAQLVHVLPADEPLWTVSARDAAMIVKEAAAWEHGGFELRRDDNDIAVVLRPGATPEGDAAGLAELAAATPTASVRVVRRRRHAAVRVLARIEDVPGYGWRPAQPSRATTPASVSDDGVTLTNGLVTITIDPANGMYALDGVSGLGQLVDGGDAGDTYNYCPPTTDVIVDRPDTVVVTAAEAGPVRASTRIEATYHWPASSTPQGRSDEAVATTVVTTLTLDAGESFVRVSVELDNRCRDHRLRAVFPLPTPATTSTAECAFAVVERGLVAEGGPTEAPLPTFPSRRFVSAGGLTIAHEGLPEYELVDVADGAAGAIAITLFRATRMLSRGPMATRPLPAGPEIEMDGSQVRGRHTLRYAIAAGAVDPYAFVEDALVPMVVSEGRGTGDQPAVHQALAVHGAPVSSLRRGAGGALELRVFNPSDRIATVTVAGHQGWLVDLRGRPQSPFDERFELAPWAIATAALTV